MPRAPLDRLKLKGFWSYARPNEEVDPNANLNAVFCTAIENKLNDRLMAVCPVEIFFDVNRDTGISSGHDWRQAIVTAIARSTLFFWAQSPKWVHSEMCRFEFDMFLAQTRRISRYLEARSISVDEKRLLGHLLTPIRWENMDDFLWNAMPEETVLRFRPLWGDIHYRGELNFANAHPTQFDIQARCLLIGEAITKDLVEVLGDHTELQRMVDFLNTDDHDFIAEWMARMPRPDGAGIHDTPIPRFGSMAEAQKRLAVNKTGGLISKSPGAFDVTFFLTPSDLAGRSGFWTSTVPVGDGLARWICQQIPNLCAPTTASSGYVVWPPDAVPAIAAMLRPHGLSIPDAEQASTLMNIDSGQRRQLGWISAPRDFWRLMPDGSAQPASGTSGGSPGTSRSLLLTMPIA